MAFHLNGYSNFHDDNQDWIVSKIKSIEDTEAHTEDLAEAAQNSADASQASAEASQLSADASQLSAETAAASAEDSQESANNSAISENRAKYYADNIADPVSGIVADWLNDNITPTTPAVDASLSVPGAAADAAVTGNKISDIMNNMSAYNFVKQTKISEKTGAYVLNTGTNTWSFRDDGAYSNNFTLEKYEVTPGNIYHVWGSIYANCCLITYVDASDNIVGNDGYVPDHSYSFEHIAIESEAPNGSVYAYVLANYIANQQITTLEKGIPTLKGEGTTTLKRNFNYKEKYDSIPGALVIVNDSVVIRTNGAYEGWTTDKYRVFPGETYTIIGEYLNVNPIAAWGLNTNIPQTALWRDEQNSASYQVKVHEITVTVPDNTYVLFISRYTENPEVFSTCYRHDQGFKNSLSGKKWYLIGDSLTAFNQTANEKYYDKLQMINGVIPEVLGIGGTGYKNPGTGTPAAFYQQAALVDTDADIVTIFGGGNDLSYELGTIDDTGTDTICGCINTTIDAVYQANPLARLGIITPCPWRSYNPATDNAMRRLSNAIIEICNKKGIPVLDLYRCSGFRPWDDTFRNLVYTMSNNDGVHPNNIGHEMLASHINEFIKQLCI